MEHDTGSAGTWATITAGATTIAVALHAGWTELKDRAERRRAERQDDRSEADMIRSNLDRATADFLTRLQSENAALRVRVELWEARARRADKWAHDFRHQICNMMVKYRQDDDPPPHVPLLEEPLFADRRDSAGE